MYAIDERVLTLKPFTFEIKLDAYGVTQVTTLRIAVGGDTDNLREGILTHWEVWTDVVLRREIKRFLTQAALGAVNI